MTSGAGKATVEGFLKHFKNETLCAVEREVGEKKEKVTVIVFNDLAFPKLREKAAAFLKGKGQNLLPLSGLWQALFDGKYNLANELVSSRIIYDTGLIEVLKASLALRESLLKKFDKYLISLVLFGSWARGAAVKESDIDLAIVIDDTDVKESTRVEIREKLRDIVHGLSAEISKKFNTQIYVLTQFWENVRDANPVIFTLLRDGVPIFDRGLFSPWKLLLKMGKIKPTPESIESFMSSSRLLIKMVQSNTKELVIEKLYYSMLNPAQAALMFIGIAPSAYNETPLLLEKYFVKKKLLDKKYATWLKEIIELRKKVEHNERAEVSGKVLDVQLQRAQEFSKAVLVLFDKIKAESISEKLSEISHVCRSGMKQALETLGIKYSEKEIVRAFMQNVVNKNLIPSAYAELVNYLDYVRRDYERGLVTQEEINKLERDAYDFVESTLNLVKNKEISGSDRFKLRCNYKNKTAEIWFLAKTAFIIKDVGQPQSGVVKAAVKKDGSLGAVQKSSLAELNRAREKVKIKRIATVKESTVESLKKIFGPKLEIVIAE